MRQGCISIGTVECNGCHNVIPYSERYLLIDEEDGEESEGGTRSSYCLPCSLDRGYAEYREEKNERILTFFPADLMQETETETGAAQEAPPETKRSTANE